MIDRQSVIREIILSLCIPPTLRDRARANLEKLSNADLSKDLDKAMSLYRRVQKFNRDQWEKHLDV